MSYLLLFTMLLFWHFIADYPLQGDFLSKAKAKAFEPAVPWYQAMLAHSFIHASGVLLITANWGFFLIELTAHFVIDKLKCDGHINFNQDQILHFMCKAGYVFATVIWFPLP